MVATCRFLRDFAWWSIWIRIEKQSAQGIRYNDREQPISCNSAHGTPHRKKEFRAARAVRISAQGPSHWMRPEQTRSGNETCKGRLLEGVIQLGAISPLFHKTRLQTAP